MRLRLARTARLWFIVGPKVYKTLSLLQEGSGGYLVQNGAIGPVKLAVSDAAGTVGTLIDAKEIAAELDRLTLELNTPSIAAVERHAHEAAGAYHHVAIERDRT